MIQREEIADPVSYTCNACIRGSAVVQYAFGSSAHLVSISLCAECEGKLQEEIDEGRTK